MRVQKEDGGLGLKIPRVLKSFQNSLVLSKSWHFQLFPKANFGLGGSLPNWRLKMWLGGRNLGTGGPPGLARLGFGKVFGCWAPVLGLGSFGKGGKPFGGDKRAEGAETWGLETQGGFKNWRGGVPGEKTPFLRGNCGVCAPGDVLCEKRVFSHGGEKVWPGGGAGK